MLISQLHHDAFRSSLTRSAKASVDAGWADRRLDEGARQLPKRVATRRSLGVSAV